jgi:hypothetical protein
VLWKEEAVDAMCCVFAERSDLSFIATEGSEQATSGGETNNHEMNRSDSYSFSTQANVSASTVTIQFRSPVMRDKKKGSAYSVNRGTRHGEAGDREGARVREPSLYILM